MIDAMWDRVQERWQLLLQAVKRPVPRRLIILFAVIGIYDTFVGQFLPKDMGESTPNIFEIAKPLAVWVASWPWWLWVFGLLATALLATLEVAVRQARQLRVTKTSAAIKAASEGSAEPSVGGKFSINQWKAFSGTPVQSPKPPESGRASLTLILDGGHISVQDSINVAFIDDHGSGEYGVGFVEALPENYFIDIRVDGSIDWKVVEKKPQYCQIRFVDYEPSRVRFIFAS